MNVEDIQRGLMKPGKSKSGLAAALGRQPSMVTALLNHQRELKAKEIPLVRAYLELDDEVTSSGINVVGYVGAGAIIEPEYEQVPPEGLGTIEVPFAVPDEIIALEVKGDSMLPRYDDGDAILCWREQRRPLSAFYGEEAAVRTEDGRRFLKTIVQGRSRNFVNLISFNAKPIDDVKLEWIGEIYLTVRSGQLQRLKAREMAAKGRRASARARSSAGMSELPLEDGDK